MTVVWILLAAAACCGSYWLGGHHCLKALRTTDGRGRRKYTRGHRDIAQRIPPQPDIPAAPPLASGRGGDTELLPRVRVR